MRILRYARIFVQTRRSVAQRDRVSEGQDTYFQGARHEADRQTYTFTQTHRRGGTGRRRGHWVSGRGEKKREGQRGEGWGGRQQDKASPPSAEAEILENIKL